MHLASRREDALHASGRGGRSQVLLGHLSQRRPRALGLLPVLEDVHLEVGRVGRREGLLKLVALSWAHAQAAALDAASLPASAWGRHPFVRIGGGVCGGGGASPLVLQPLDVDDAPVGEPWYVHLRKAAASADGAPSASGGLGTFDLALTAGTADGAPADDAWESATSLEWCASARRFRALVEGTCLSGSAITRELETAGRVGTAVDLFSGGDALRVLVMDVAQTAQLHLSSSAGAAAAQSAVHSPMPGKIVRVLAREGEAVAAGEPLVVLEAMKMEHTLKAATDVTIAAVHAAEGDVVGQRALLLSFKQEQASAAS